MRVALPCLFLVVLTAAACGSSSKQETPERFAHDYELASCEHRVECGTMPDVQTCLAVTDDDPLDDDYSYATLVDSVRAGRVAFDADAAASCVDAMADAPCDPAGGEAEPSCREVFAGAVAEGGECVTHLDCTSGQCEGLPCLGQCCRGVCAAPRPEVRISGEGEGCDDASTECADGLWCSYDGWTSTCTRQAAAGESCASWDECAAGLECLGAGTAHQACGRRPAPGEACDPMAWSDCAGLDRFYCDPSSATCAPRKPVGAACSTGPDVRDLGCVDYAWCPAGTCELLPTEGERCDDMCLGDLTCSDDGICLPAESFGVDCA